MSKGTYVVTANVDFGESKEPIAFRAGLYHFAQNQVHPVVAGHQVAVQGLAVLELDQHRVALCGREEAEGQLLSQRSAHASYNMRRRF